MLIGSNKALFKTVHEPPIQRGCYAVRNSKMPTGYFHEAMYWPDKGEWTVLTDEQFYIEDWRYLTLMEKHSTLMSQTDERRLGCARADYALYELMVFMADVSVMPRTRPALERELGYNQRTTSRMVLKARALGVIIGNAGGRVAKPLVIDSWGAIDKTWVYRNYEILKRKLSDYESRNRKAK